PRYVPELGPLTRHTPRVGSPLRAACDGTLPSFRLVRGPRMPHGLLPREPERLLLRRLDNRAGQSSSNRSRSQHLAVTLLADGLRGVGSAAKVFAIGKKCWSKLRIGEERLNGRRRRRNDLGDQTPAFGHIHLPRRRPPDPVREWLSSSCDSLCHIE